MPFALTINQCSHKILWIFSRLAPSVAPKQCFLFFWFYRKHTEQRTRKCVKFTKFSLFKFFWNFFIHFEENPMLRNFLILWFLRILGSRWWILGKIHEAISFLDWGIFDGGCFFSAIWGGSGFLTAPPDLRNMGGAKKLPPLGPEIWGGKKQFSPNFFCRFFWKSSKKIETFFLKIPNKKFADFFENIQKQIPIFFWKSSNKISISNSDGKPRRRRKFFRI